MPSSSPRWPWLLLLLVPLAQGCGSSSTTTAITDPGDSEDTGSGGTKGSGAHAGASGTGGAGGTGGTSDAGGASGQGGAGSAGPGGAGGTSGAGNAGPGGFSGTSGFAGAGATSGAGTGGTAGDGGAAGQAGAGAVSGGGDGGASGQAGAGGDSGAGGMVGLCMPGTSEPCKAMCGKGQRVCFPNGLWSECQQVDTGNAVELCDGIDNNCDGQIDEGISEDCSNTCGKGTRTCVVGGTGKWGACSAKEPEIEVCDGIDNDCNGQVDDSLIKPCGDCNLGYSLCDKGTWTSCQTDIIPDSFQLIGTLRDFHAFNYGGDFPHPDFENAGGDDKDIVTDLIGPDNLPVYKPLGDLMTPTTHGKKWFDMWYRDTPDYNLSKEHAIVLTRKPGVTPPTYVYDNPSFFPLDGQLFGAEGNAHNFSFTYELHSTFYYRGGEHFYFRGDDDLYVFVDGHLLINLGGVHGAEGQDIDIDAAVSQFNLKKCMPYQIDLFFAERHTNASSFRIETSLILLAQ